MGLEYVLVDAAHTAQDGPRTGVLGIPPHAVAHLRNRLPGQPLAWHVFRNSVHRPVPHLLCSKPPCQPTSATCSGLSPSPGT